MESMKDGEATVGGGVEDVYGEDRATEDQLVTPWTVSVARYISLLKVSLTLVCANFVIIFAYYLSLISLE